MKYVFIVFVFLSVSLFSQMEKSKNHLINKKDRYGESPLFQAVKSKNLEIISLFIRLKADFKIKNLKGDSLTHVAVRKGNLDLLKLVLKNGASLDDKNKRGETPLSLAVILKKQELAIFLIDKGANVNVELKGRYGRKKNLVHHAYDQRNTKLLKTMRRKGAFIFKRDHRGRTLIHYAVINGDLKLLKALLGK